ncbi:MAG: hypothetical protein VYC34_01720, partial [Planctomycetota bacterium]|nr:hypothetical protein [Planctomycetota bacterium]
MGFRGTQSLRFKLLGPLLGLGVAVAFVAAALTHRTVSAQMVRQMELRGEVIANSLNAMIRVIDGTPELSARPEELQRVVKDIETLPEVSMIVVVNGDPPRVVASTRRDWIGRAMRELPWDRVQVDLEDAIETRRKHTHWHRDTHEFDVSWPLALQREDRP